MYFSNSTLYLKIKLKRSIKKIIFIFLDRNGANSTMMIADHLNETITKIELLVATNTYGGNLDKIYDVIETFSLYRQVITYLKNTS